MSERKVFSKYYPPDFDPSKVPRRKAKDVSSGPRQVKIRMMLPINVQCSTCGEIIKSDTKFNARKEAVQGEKYLGSITVLRFYMKCPMCAAEFTIRTDPEHFDYAAENGCKRLYSLLKEEADRKAKVKDEKESLESDPLKLLEARTAENKAEMEAKQAIDALQSQMECRNTVSQKDLLSSIRAVHAGNRDDGNVDDRAREHMHGYPPVFEEVLESDGSIVDDGHDGHANEQTERRLLDAGVVEPAAESKKRPLGSSRIAQLAMQLKSKKPRLESQPKVSEGLRSLFENYHSSSDNENSSNNNSNADSAEDDENDEKNENDGDDE
eukprot:ANDGO_05311.mRNA.1 Coiled-coil domain-containing protein 94 homolog